MSIVKTVVPPVIVLSIVSMFCSTFYSGCCVTTLLGKVATKIKTIVVSMICSVKGGIMGSGS